MSECCSKCVEQKRECRCLTCTSCEADIATENKLLFKKKKLFCRRCSLPLCGKCHMNLLCVSCHNVQESYNALWKEIDFSISLTVSSKEKDFDNALEDMIEAIRSQSLSTLQNLIEHCGKAYVYKCDESQQTLLHHAVQMSDVSIIQYLLEQGSNVNHVDSDSCSVLHVLASGNRTPYQGQICDMLVSSGVNTFLLNEKRETAISLQTDNFELQSLLEPTMYRDSSVIILKFLNSNPDLPDDVTACLRYIISKIKCLNPFEKKQSRQVSRQKSMNYRSLKDKGSVLCDGVDPYKLKKTVADNNEKITRLKEEIMSLREQLVQNTVDHRAQVKRLEDVLAEEKENKNYAAVQHQNYFTNAVKLLEADLEEAKNLEEDAKQALDDVLYLNRRFKMCWVPKKATRKCASPSCLKVFRDGYSQHHCRCCGRVFCYQCSIQRVPIPVYGYENPVRVCNYCYNLLNEEVLCDFDETDIDIDQWNSVHYQNESNTDNLGKKLFFTFQQAKNRTATIASGSKSRSLGDSSLGYSNGSKTGDSDGSKTGYSGGSKTGDSESVSESSLAEPRTSMCTRKKTSDAGKGTSRDADSGIKLSMDSSCTVDGSSINGSVVSQHSGSQESARDDAADETITEAERMSSEPEQTTTEAEQTSAVTEPSSIEESNTTASVAKEIAEETTAEKTSPDHSETEDLVVVRSPRLESGMSDVYSDSESTLSNTSEPESQASFMSQSSQWKENLRLSFSSPGQKLQRLFRNNSLKRTSSPKH